MDECHTSVTKIDVKNIYRLVTYISWSSDFALCLEDFLMDECYNWYMGQCATKIDLIKYM